MAEQINNNNFRRTNKRKRWEENNKNQQIINDTCRRTNKRRRREENNKNQQIITIAGGQIKEGGGRRIIMAIRRLLGSNTDRSNCKLRLKLFQEK